MDPAEKVLARVSPREAGAYSAGPFAVGSGHLSAYFTCTGGGSIEITLGKLATYTESCATGTVTRGRELYDVMSEASVLLLVQARDVGQWSFVLTATA
jgi:hypothetical protein